MTEGAEYARLLAENQRYTEAFDRSALTAAPLTGLAIVACMDARLDVEETLGLRTGDAHIIRNAGGLVTDDVIRSLIVSQRAPRHRRDRRDPAHAAAACTTSTRTPSASASRRTAGVTAEDVAIAFGGFTDLDGERAGPGRASCASTSSCGACPSTGSSSTSLTGRLHEVA